MVSRYVGQRKNRRYVCKSCHLSVKQAEADLSVLRSVQRALQVQPYWQGAAEDERGAPEGLLEALQAAEARQAQLMRSYYIDGAMPDELFAELSSSLQEQIHSLSEQLAADQDPPDYMSLLEQLPELTTETQRLILREVLASIQVEPADLRHPVRVADRLLLTFHDEESPRLASALLH